MTVVRQGDVLCILIAKTQGEFTTVARVGGRVILAAGEVTGHHHAIGENGVELFEPKEPGKCSFFMEGEPLALDVRGLGVALLEVSEPANLVHEEHGPHALEPGKYLVLRQRERSFSDFEAYRAVAD